MQIIAHRGAHGITPENTLASFKKAIEVGADMIEFDVFALRTGEVVVIHDETVDRTTNGTGHVQEFKLEQLRQLDAGRGEKIPLLTEVLDLVKHKVPVNIELKGKGSAKPVSDIVKRYMAKEGWSADQFLVSSYDHKELRRFARLCPGIKLGALLDEEPTSIIFNRLPAKAVFSANLDVSFVTEKEVNEAHAKGLKVYVHTVNTKPQAKRLEKMNVDGIFTDRPEKFTALAHHH